MTVIFHIEYFTFDASLRILFDDGASVDMQYSGGGLWCGTRELEGREVHYRYCVCSDGRQLRTEPDVEAHTLRLPQNVARLEVYDRWYERPTDAAFMSSLFTDAVFRRGSRDVAAVAASGYILVEVEAPTLCGSETLAVAGAAEALGGWDVSRAVEMSDADAPLWRVLLPCEAAGSEYKFVVRDRVAGALSCWEGGGNRRLPAADGGVAVVETGLRLRDGRPRWRGAGIAVPLFSLRSVRDWGVGEFRDIGLLSEWAAAAGMSVIQLLPVNDTSVTGTWRDSYPYNPLSCFALHPLYVCCADAAEMCRQVCTAAQAERIDTLLAELSPRGEELNALPEVDYEAAMALKENFLRRIYDICGYDVVASAECRGFAMANAEWLVPYTVFRVLREEHGDGDRTLWGPLEHYDRVEAERYAALHRRETEYHSFVQYVLDSQLRRARDYAHSLGVALKGDIPIGVAPTGADAWQSPELFNLGMSAGAPPDAFAAEGQNWGFPTYDWQHMAADGYGWWRRRLRKMGKYFDAYRLDHILGFFRIWEVPRNAASALLGHFNPQLPMSRSEIEGYGFPFEPRLHAACDLSSADVLFLAADGCGEGYFPRIGGCDTAAFRALDEADREAYRRLHDDFYYRRHDALWRGSALRKLPVLTAASQMLACGEDLGMIPACVPEVMADEMILSLEIERMPKQAGVAFADPSRYPYLSVAATSTHDMPTLRGWWREDVEAARCYYRDVLHCGGGAPRDCTAEIARRIVERHMRSASMLAVLPLQDWLAIDSALRSDDPDAERINVPAITPYYWRYRVHLTLERLLAEDGFTDAVRRLTALRAVVM